MKVIARRADGEKTLTDAMVPGRYGFSGSHVHLCTITFYVQDEGKPWQRTVVTSARPACTGIRRGDKHAHSLQMNAELTTKTITCEKCREFGCVEVEKPAAPEERSKMSEITDMQRNWMKSAEPAVNDLAYCLMRLENTATDPRVKDALGRLRKMAEAIQMDLPEALHEMEFGGVKEA